MRGQLKALTDIQKYPMLSWLYNLTFSPLRMRGIPHGKGNFLFMEEKELSSTYELTVLLPQELSDFDIQKVIDKVKATITSRNGSIQKENNWGKKRLAYHIGKIEFAHYHTLIFQALKEAVLDITKDIQLMPEIIRHLLISLEKEGVGADQLFSPEKEAAILVSTVKEKMEPRTPVEPRFRAAAKPIEVPKATEEPVETVEPTAAAPEEVIEPVVETEKETAKRRKELDKKLDELLKE